VDSGPSQSQQDRDFIVSDSEKSARCAYEEDEEDFVSSGAGEMSGVGWRKVYWVK